MRNEFGDRSDDLGAQFWGEPTASNRRRPAGAPKDDTPVTGAIRAVRDSWAAFKPRASDGTGSLPRTRQHNTIDSTGAQTRRSPDAFSPPSRRKRVARHDLSIAELAAGETSIGDPAWDDLDDWSELDALTARHEAMRASRQHRVDFAAPIDDRTPMAPRRPDPSRAAMAGARFQTPPPGEDPAATASHQIPLSSQLAEKVGWRGADPLLVRGVLAALVTLALLPLLWLRGGDDSAPVATNQIEAPTVTEPAATGAPTVAATTPTTVAADVVQGQVTTSTAQASKAPAATAAPQTTAAKKSSKSTNKAADDKNNDTGSSGKSSGTSGTTKSTERAAPDCSNKYKVVAGDSWYGIADRANVSVDALLKQNSATTSTVILPGDKICLPAGADDPTVATTSTNAPTTTKAPTSTTNAPTTTSAPTTTKAPSGGSPGPNATPEQVKQVIRDVFPDELEAKALDIAYRESRYVPTADNGICCHGVFQIYYSVHKSWLSGMGINSAQDLHDPLLNAKAALELYRRAGNSWSPWTTA